MHLWIGTSKRHSRCKWTRIFTKDVLFDIRAIRCSALRSKVRVRAWELLSAGIASSDYDEAGF